MRRAPVTAAVALTALLGLYGYLVATRAVALMGTGKPIGVGLGLATVVLPGLVLWAIAREFLLAIRVQRMADELADAGALPVDDLPRSPGGRIDRAAATQAFDLVKAEVEAGPESWQAWYHLAFAYDAAGDRRRARATLRRAAAMWRAAA